MRIRRAKQSELDYVYNLDYALFAGEELSPSEMEDRDWWVAVEGFDILGYCAGKYLDHANAYYLSRAGVTPRARGRGIQKRLIRTRVQRAKALDCQYALSYTLPGNAVSSNNLIACGFRLYEPEEHWAGSEALYWLKEIK